MKKKLLIIVLIVVLIISGYFILNEFKKKQWVNEAQEKAEEYLIVNYEDVESVQVSTDNYHLKPTGTLGRGGHINNKEYLPVYITFLIKGNAGGDVISSVEAPDFPSSKIR